MLLPEQVTLADRPQTIGYSLADSPVCLVAGCSTMTRTVTGNWLTNTGTSAARLYWENARVAYKGEISVPAAFTVFPGELWRAPRTWVEKTYSNLVYFNEVDRAVTSLRGNSRSFRGRSPRGVPIAALA
jgi:hypothetical protein